jgi:nucleotide-binding universal stress UspA family protein
MPTIVVGVDGSDDAQTALRFAVEEAKLRAAPLRVICAWELPVQNWGELPPPDGALDRPRQRADEIVAEAAEIVERLAPSVRCKCMTLEGELGALLVEHSSDASLVVVPRHGHGLGDRLLGSVADAVLGSVSLHVVRDARCPVVVVPHGYPLE